MYGRKEKILSRSSTVLLLALLTGCASIPTQKGAALPKATNESSIVLCRQNGGHLALRGIDAFVNGREVATLRLGSNREVIVKPGQHTITFKFPWDSGIQDLGVQVAVAPGASKNVTIGTNLDGFIILPSIGGFRTTWRVAESPQLPSECSDPNRHVVR